MAMHHAIYRASQQLLQLVKHPTAPLYERSIQLTTRVLLLSTPVDSCGLVVDTRERSKVLTSPQCISCAQRVETIAQI